MKDLIKIKNKTKLIYTLAYNNKYTNEKKLNTYNIYINIFVVIIIHNLYYFALINDI